MGENIGWGLVWAAGGWVVAQFTAILQFLAGRYWLRRAIESELVQVADELDRLWLVYARNLQIHTIGGVPDGVPLPLANFIYTNHYKDASLVFTRVQRIAIQMIHAYIGELNTVAGELRSLVMEVQEQEIRTDSMEAAHYELYGRRIRGAMNMVGIARWHVRYYREHPLFPVLDYKSDTHVAYAKYIDEMSDEIERIVKNAAKLTRADFDKAYNPGAFGLESGDK